MYPCGRWQHPYSIHSWLLEALPLVQAMVDAAYGNNRLEGICEDDSIPSTRTSNPGPGSNVMASSKKTKIRIRIPRNPISQKIPVLAIYGKYTILGAPDRLDDRSCVTKSEKYWHRRQKQYRDTRKALEIVQIFHGKQLPGAGIPEFRKTTTLREGL